jgi:hypothetical protein
LPLSQRRQLEHVERLRDIALDLTRQAADVTRWNAGAAARVARTHRGMLQKTCMIAITWQFDVKKGREAEFEQLHGVDGEWTILNRQTRSYLGSSFLREQNRATRYLLVEYWSEMLVYEQHKAYRSDAIASLERRRTELVENVEPLGVFTALNVPDRFGPTWSQR